MRMWITIGVILVCNITVVIVIGSLIGKFLKQCDHDLPHPEIKQQGKQL